MQYNSNLKFKITTIIPTHGRPDLLKQTLDSFVHCELPPEYNELIIIENGQKLGAERLVSSLPSSLNARYAYVEEANKSSALNIALDILDDDHLIFFTDDDAQFHPDLVSAYLEAAYNHGKGHFFGGPVNVIREEEPPDWMELLLPFSARGYDLVNSRMKNKYLGINWAAFSQDIIKIGGFDPRFGPGSIYKASGQESEIQERMLKAGFKAVDVPKAIVWHKVPKKRCNEKWLKERFFRYGISKGIKKHEFPDILQECANMLKYLFRWMIYLILLNKTERKKSLMEVIDRSGYFYYLLTKK